MKLQFTGTASVFGLAMQSGRAMIATHEFDIRADGATHYVDGTKRAEIEAQHWPAYCEGVPEAAEAQRRVEAAAQAAAA